MKRAYLAVGVGVVGIAVAAVLYLQERRVAHAETEAGISASRVLTAVFSKVRRLDVAHLHGDVQAKSACDSLYWINNEQTTVAPYSVYYSLDMRGLKPGSYRWNAKDRIIVVDSPAVQINMPAVDMSKARTAQTGIFISRKCGVGMQQIAASRLSNAALRKAQEPENIAKAQKAAREAITVYVQGPLEAVGMAAITVEVRLPGEERPQGIEQEQWDISRSIADVLGNAYDAITTR